MGLALALQAACTLRPALQANSLYKRGLATGAGLARSAASTQLYASASTRLYPIVQPLADPVLAKLGGSKAVASVLKYWAPL